VFITSTIDAPRVPIHTAADGITLHYTDFGTGTPVVLVHSWSLSSTMWEYQVDALLTAGYRCIALDRRGHGRSEVAGTGYDLDRLTDDLAGLIEALDLRDAAIVAHSMGSCETTHFLARYGSARVARVVFLAPVTRQILDAPLAVQIACARAFATVDLSADLRGIDVPVLVLHGTADASAPHAITAVPTAALLRDGRLVTYDGAPHGLYVTHKDAVNAEILAFLAGSAAAPV